MSAPFDPPPKFSPTHPFALGQFKADFNVDANALAPGGLDSSFTKSFVVAAAAWNDNFGRLVPFPSAYTFNKARAWPFHATRTPSTIFFHHRQHQVELKALSYRNRPFIQFSEQLLELAAVHGIPTRIGFHTNYAKVLLKHIYKTMTKATVRQSNISGIRAQDYLPGLRSPNDPIYEDKVECARYLVHLDSLSRSPYGTMGFELGDAASWVAHSIMDLDGSLMQRFVLGPADAAIFRQIPGFIQSSIDDPVFHADLRGIEELFIGQTVDGDFYMFPPAAVLRRVLPGYHGFTQETHIILGQIKTQIIAGTWTPLDKDEWTAYLEEALDELKLSSSLTPSVILTEANLDYGEALWDLAIPEQWNGADLHKIKLPIFTPTHVMLLG
ncbi:hypothetical protein CYLTODRAFT_479484 [Cylindrobasidium torrendii FP15055 ss-10]|uniref:Uncharacterized protein n=1 Tax=Cylindrobasidium torrendii FP15055 ss-10 TaxID=1314674 RepID=A0A0D7AVE5_9AGAR|nr:hypothetical protein CYLTODRAFT_479484 [Cylindrobasidium torrendii FP15055 ss-10]